MTRSLSTRLTAAIAAAIVVVGVPAAIVSFASAFQEAYELQDDQLRQLASVLELTELSSFRSELDASDPDSKLVVQFLDADRSTPHPSPSGLNLPEGLPDGLQTVSSGGDTWRLFVLRPKSGKRIAVAQRTSGRDETARDSGLRTLVPFAILLPILLVLIGIITRSTLRPMARLAVEVDARSESDLAALAVRDVPSEARPFIESINRLLQRLRGAIDAQQRFIADAAHELRSPMTALMVQAENLEHVTPPGEASNRLARLKTGLTRFRLLLEQLLALARAQSAQEETPVPVQIAALLRSVLEDLMPLADAASIDIGLIDRSDRQSLCIDRADAAALFRNLIDNAIRYTPQGGRVDVRVTTIPSAVMIEVIDSGPGIPESEMARVFDPFYRLTGTQEIGSGLGLSIVKKILERIGGTIELQNRTRESGSGLRVLIVIPSDRTVR